VVVGGTFSNVVGEISNVVPTDCTGAPVCELVHQDVQSGLKRSHPIQTKRETTKQKHKMAVTKQQFMNRPKIRPLRADEKERRWKQHLMSEGGIRDQHIHGRGDYFSGARKWANKQLARLPKGSFATAGRFLGGVPGELAGKVISELTGHGDYTIKKNSLIRDGNVLQPGEMSFAPSGASSIRVQKREFVENIVVPADPTKFDQHQLRLQCTDSTTFPWLSDIAKHFTEWELHGAIFSYESTSSNYSSDMALGRVAIATQYNANELPYTSMESMLQSAFHSRANPSENMMHGIECDPTLQASEHLFTRRHGASGPPNLYDHGVVTVATEGLPATTGTIIGSIFVTYDIELNLPALPTDNLNQGLCAAVWCNATTTEPPMGDSTTLGTSPMANLTNGTAAGSNLLELLPSNGPWARPQLAPAFQSSLLMWVSDSAVQQGTQYLSFANPGNYEILMVARGATATPGSFCNVAAVTADCTAVLTFNNLTDNPIVCRIRVKTTATDQAIELIRTSATNYSTLTVITIC